MRKNLYDPKQRAYRIQYAQQCIMRGMQSSTRHFDTCFEMGDANEIATALLRRGLKNARLREAMYNSPIVGLDHWLNSLHPEFRDAYAALDPKYLARRLPH